MAKYIERQIIDNIFTTKKKYKDIGYLIQYYTILVK